MFSTTTLTLMCALIGVQGLRCHTPRCFWSPPFCTYGRKLDADGCDSCECAKRPEAVAPVDVVPVPEVDECETPVCQWTTEVCQYGRKKDGDGCDTCECAAAPVDPIPFPVTEAECFPLGVTCRMLCEFGWAKDDKGCDMCECAEPKPSCDENTQCEVECLYGRTRNENGCEICECAQEPVYNCQSKEEWSKEKVEFCCQVEGLGCPPPKQPQYNCLSRDWTKEQWSKEKREFCCESMNIACDVEVAMAKRSIYNCMSRELWSEDKKSFCCATAGLGCATTSVRAKGTNTKGGEVDKLDIATREVVMEPTPERDETDEELLRYFDHYQRATQSATGHSRSRLPRARARNRNEDQATILQNIGA